MPLYRGVVESPLGPLTLLVSGRGVRSILFGDRPGPAEAAESETGVRTVARQLREYFQRRRRTFDLELDWEGTPFQQRVWSALLRIPYGETASYADIARQVRKPRAFRAVGGANRRNPLAIVVPCHRVLGSDGSLTGYAGTTGLDKKAFLLRLESAPPAAHSGARHLRPGKRA